PKGHDFDPALHARPLFGQGKLATCKVVAGLREEDRDLDRECVIAVEVLMQAVEITRHILQQQRRWARLTGVVASLEERRVDLGITLVTPHPAVPFVGDSSEVRIERCSQASNEVRKRVFEVAVLAPAEAMPRHVNVASEVALVRIERCDGAALLSREKFRQDGAAVVAELACERAPVVCRNPRLCGYARRGMGDGGRTRVHAVASFLISSRLRSTLHW